MTLYEIDNAILDCVDMETGEIIDAEKLDELSLARDEKIESVALWIKNLKAEAEALKAEKESFAQRQKVAENKVESLKRYLADALDGEKFSTSKVAISFRRSESVQIADDIDPTSLPPEFTKVKLDYDKTAMKKALKDGEKIEGVSLVTNNNIQIK